MPQNMVIDIQLSLYCLSVKLKFCPFIKSIFVLSNKSTLKQSSKKHPTIAINPDGFLAAMSSSSSDNVTQSVHPSICPSIRPSIRPFVRLFVRLFVRPSPFLDYVDVYESSRPHNLTMDD